MESLNIFLSGIQYELGDKKELSSLFEQTDNIDDEEILKNLGLKFFRKSKVSMPSMLVKCAQRTLAESGIDPLTIKSVLFVTSSLQDHSKDKNEIGEMLCQLGLKNAYPVGIFLSRCTNFSIAIQTAMNLIKAEGQDSILVLISDVTSKSPNTPALIPSNVSVSSDAAVSFIVSKTVACTFKVLGTEHITNQKMWNSTASAGFVGHFRLFSTALKSLIKRTLDKYNLEQENIKYLITGNYNLSVQRNYASMLGFKNNQLYSKMLPDIAHAFACDQLISMYSIAHHKLLNYDDKLLLLGTGDYYLGTVILEYKN